MDNKMDAGSNLGSTAKGADLSFPIGCCFSIALDAIASSLNCVSTSDMLSTRKGCK